MDPLINLPESSKGSPIHVLVTAPGAIAGTDGQREEIAASLPKPDAGKIWQYQPISTIPFRFATPENADAFMAALKENVPTDHYFIPPMVYDQKRGKWSVNKLWGEAVGELVVFVQVDIPKINGLPPLKISTNN